MLPMPLMLPGTQMDRDIHGREAIAKPSWNTYHKDRSSRDSDTNQLPATKTSRKTKTKTRKRKRPFNSLISCFFCCSYIRTTFNCIVFMRALSMHAQTSSGTWSTTCFKEYAHSSSVFISIFIHTSQTVFCIFEKTALSRRLLHSRQS